MKNSVRSGLCKDASFSSTRYQAYRDDEGIKVFKKQLMWIKPRLEAVVSKRNKK